MSNNRVYDHDIAKEFEALADEIDARAKSSFKQSGSSARGARSERIGKQLAADFIRDKAKSLRGGK